MSPNGRGVYLDFYIDSISQEILHSETSGKRHSNKSVRNSIARSLSRDVSISLTNLGQLL